MVVVATGSDDEVSSVDADSGVVKPTGRSDFARAVVAIVLGLGIARLDEVLDEFELNRPFRLCTPTFQNLSGI